MFPNTHDMPTLPQLIEEDVQLLDGVLRDFLDRSEASVALLIDKGGFLITHSGDAEKFDLITIAALASGAYLANQTIAGLVHEENFNSVYQQGENFSMLITDVDQHCLLVTIFQARISVGAVKYFAAGVAGRIGKQMKIAYHRNPKGGLDLSALNLENPSVVFHKKS
jgi:predicted regulator of Ras-like GTPase activity (Roadblock/LC7/MglB family)